MSDPLARIRREPPSFRLVTVARTEVLTPHLRRVVLTGPALDGLDRGLPAASVRLLLPGPGQPLVVPTWAGNEFLHGDGQRPIIRTYTPRHLDADRNELTIDVVLHPHGIAAAWAEGARPGDPAAVAGTGRGYAIDPLGTTFLLGGDESAVPAISVLLEVLPTRVAVTVLVEIRHADARLDLPAHPGAQVQWLEADPAAASGTALLDAVQGASIEPGVHVWVAGEAAAVQRIRRHLFDARGLPRTQCTVRGYWKHGRAGDDDT